MPVALETSRELLAVVEAEVGCLLEFLPIPVIVTSESGIILRANAAAILFVDAPVPLIGIPIQDILRAQAISAWVTTLRHEGTVVRVHGLRYRD